MKEIKNRNLAEKVGHAMADCFLNAVGMANDFAYNHAKTEKSQTVLRLMVYPICQAIAPFERFYE